MRIRTFLTMILLAAAAGAFTQDAPLDAAAIARLKKGVAEAAVSTSTIIANFTQEKEMSILDEKIRSSGTFYFKKEKMLRWEYIKPYSYIIVINNDRITMRDEKKTTQADSRNSKLFSQVNSIMVGSIRGTLLNDEQNYRMSFHDGKSAWVARLAPLTPPLNTSLKEITLFFSKQDFSVDRLEMMENTGDRTVIIFTEKRFNQPVADEKFVLH